jgi:hypothetical protein
MIYPNGRILWVGYNTTTTTPPDWAAVDNRISRLSFLADHNAGQIGQHLEARGTACQPTTSCNSTTACDAGRCRPKILNYVDAYGQPTTGCHMRGGSQ